MISFFGSINLPKCWLLLLLISSRLGYGSLQPQSQNRPNILWITCEDMSAHFPALKQFG